MKSIKFMFQILHTNPFLTVTWKTMTLQKPNFYCRKGKHFKHMYRISKTSPQKNEKSCCRHRKFESLLLSVQVPRTFLTSFHSSFTLLLLPKREEASSNDDVRRLWWSFHFGMHNPSISIWQLERPENSICVFTQGTYLDFAEKWKEKLLRKLSEHVNCKRCFLFR